MSVIDKIKQALDELNEDELHPAVVRDIWDAQKSLDILVADLQCLSDSLEADGLEREAASVADLIDGNEVKS